MKVSRLDARSQIAKESFRSTFAGKSAEDEMNTSDSSTELKQKKKKKQTDKQSQIQNIRKRKRQYSQTTDQTTSSLTEETKYHACEQDHDFHVCYYLFFNKVSD